MARDRWYKLLGLFCAAFLCFNFPLLNLFSKGRFVGGAPLLFFYLFLAWAVLIFLTMRIAGSNDKAKP